MAGRAGGDTSCSEWQTHTGRQGKAESNPAHHAGQSAPPSIIRAPTRTLSHSRSLPMFEKQQPQALASPAAWQREVGN